MIVEHANAVKVLLSPLTFTLYDSNVPAEPQFPYVVWRMTTGYGEGTKICNTTDLETFRVYATSVGLSADAARIVADAVRAVLLDQRPTVAGWACNRLKRETSIPIQEDRDVTIPPNNLHPVYAVDTYVFESRKD